MPREFKYFVQGTQLEKCSGLFSFTYSFYMQLRTWRLMLALLGLMNSDCSLDSVTRVKIFSLLDLGNSFNWVTLSKDEHTFLQERCDSIQADISRVF